MTLFEECMIALGKDARLLEEHEAQPVLENFDNCFPLNSWGRIDWNKIEVKKLIPSIEAIIPTLKEIKKDPSGLVYIIGGNASIPIIESTLNKILEFFDDIECLSHISWFYCPSNGWIIEIDDDGTITLGIA